jgi:hypothetical protein
LEQRRHQHSNLELPHRKHRSLEHLPVRRPASDPSTSEYPSSDHASPSHPPPGTTPSTSAPPSCVSPRGRRSC